jgi:hypothetical protein
MTSGQFRVAATTVYVLTMIALVLGLFRARQWVAGTYSDNAARSEWQSFRDDVVRQSTDNAPVRRRVPQSAEPPALVLMRDYFVVCLAISLVLSTALFATMTLFVGGVVVSDARGVPR